MSGTRESSAAPSALDADVESIIQVVDEEEEEIPNGVQRNYDYLIYGDEDVLGWAGESDSIARPVTGIDENFGSYFGDPAEASEKLEQTLGIVMPEAMKYIDEIFALTRKERLAILKVRRVQLTPEQASQFYQDAYDTPEFTDQVAHLYSGPILAVILSGPGAVEHWLRLIGPESYKERSDQPQCFRARFGTPESDIKHGLHGSATEADALRELHFFFPELIVEPTIADNLSSYYLNENVHPVLTVGLSKLVRERPDDPVLWLANWLLSNNPNKIRATNIGKSKAASGIIGAGQRCAE